MCYILSIEDIEGQSFKCGYHLGTILSVAKQIAEERFHGRIRVGLPVVSVALLADGKMRHFYDGKWEEY